jgi:asparagine N-glycosylation enzyme membrane subunit Stt3
MPNNRIQKKQRLNRWVPLLLLALIVVLAVTLDYYPHLNYPYSLHVDEWYHIYIAEYIGQHGHLPQNDIYLGKFGFTDPEQGFHFLLALVYKAFNLGITQWDYLTLVMGALSVLAVFYFVSKLFGTKEALIAAFLTALLPTNNTMGGPALLIPVNLCLMLIPIALVFAFELVKIRPIYNYLALFLVTTLILYSHPPAALVLLIIIGIYFLLNLFSNDGKNRVKAEYLFITISLSVVVSLPNYLPDIQASGGVSNAVTFTFNILLGQIPYVYGILQTLFFVIGFYLLAGTNDKKNISLLATCAILMLIIVLFANFGVNFIIPYQRVYVPLFLLMSIIASKGYLEVLKVGGRYKAVGIIAFIALLAATLYFSVEADISTPYYHIISSAQYQDFVWIKDNLPGNSTVILDPWLAKAFGPITMMKVYSVMPFGPNAIYNTLMSNTYTFFNGNCTDTHFLLQNNISVVYTDSPCYNANLTLVHNSTYVLDDKASKV